MRQQRIRVAAYSFPVIAIRLAAEADAPALAKIAVAAYQHYVPRIGRPPAPMTADYSAAVRRGQAWVAAVDGEVAGFIILISRPGYLLLENVAVLPAAQGRGIGARLLALAEDRARRGYCGRGSVPAVLPGCSPGPVPWSSACGCAGGVSRVHRADPGRDRRPRPPGLICSFLLVRGAGGHAGREDGGGLPVTPVLLWDRSP
jgi:GNAT superfamily N-acetyltransferase